MVGMRQGVALTMFIATQKCVSFTSVSGMRQVVALALSQGMLKILARASCARMRKGVALTLSLRGRAERRRFQVVFRHTKGRTPA